MNTPAKSFAIMLAGVLCLGAAGNARAAVAVSAAFSVHATAEFEAPLAPLGVWVDVAPFGRCWHPRSVAAHWRPYVTGYWVWTDVGWFWVSDEPWAWACYHYGSWVLDSQQGWIWIPGIEWSPAWVSWRVGGGFIGWAPLPPSGVAVSVSLPAPPFIFVELRNFHQPCSPANVIVNDTKIINKTTVINNIRAETKTIGDAGQQKVMVNEGPGLAAVQQATGNKVTTLSVQEAVQKAPAPASLQKKNGEPKAAQPGKPGTEAPKQQPKPGEEKEKKGPAPKAPQEKQPPPKSKEPPRATPPTPQPPVPPAPPEKILPPEKGKGKEKERPPEVTPPTPPQAPVPPVPPEKGKGKGKKKEKGPR